MPVFQIQTPDGRKFEIDAPDVKSAAATVESHADHPSLKESFQGGALRGVPIVGPILEGTAERIGAGIGSLVKGTKYSEELKAVQDRAEKEQTENPLAETAGEIIGGVGSLGALGGTTVGARLLGMTGKTLPELMARGAASGTVLNAADSEVRGENPITGGAVGGVVGGLAPVAGRIVNAATKPVQNVIRGIVNPGEEAERRVATALDRDIKTGSGGLTPTDFVAAKKSGQPVNLMDVGGETTRSLARSAANTSPEGREVLNRSINDRFEGQSDRLSDWLRTNFHYPDAVAQQEALESASRTANRGAYAKAYQEGSKGLWSPELERLAGSDAVAAAMKAAAKNAKDEAIVSGHGAMNPNITFTPDGRIQFTKGPKGVPTYPDLQFWDLTRRELSDAAVRAGPGTAEARRYTAFAKALNSELDTLVPSYGIARAGAASFFGAQDALEAGQKAVTSKMTNSQIRTGLAKMSATEKQLFQDGFVDRYIQTMREMPDRRSVLNTIGQSPAARERLALALGPQKAKSLEAMLRIEGIMDLARPAVQGNSTTARQLVELGLAGGSDLYQGGGKPTADPQALLNAALVYGAARGHRVIDERVAQMVARLLASSDLNQLNRGMRLLASNQNLLAAIRNADAGLAAVAARGTAPVVSRKIGLQ